MIPQASDVKFKSVGVLETVDMSLDAGSTSHIMSILSNLYQNPLAAICREYCTNARDSHLQSGNKDIPIEITLPTVGEPTFVIRDFGLGMSKEEVYEVFARYGASTKRESNDFNGQLGFGCKSAFTVTPQFVVITVKDGVQNIFTLHLNERNFGSVSLFSSQEVDADNGVTIQIPIKVSSFTDFYKAFDSFMYFFDAPVEIVNTDAMGVSKSIHVKKGGIVNFREGYKYKDLEIYDFSGCGEPFFPDSTDTLISGGGYVTMGGVAYYSKSIPVNHVFVAAIGDVQFAPSREGLLDSPQNTKFIADRIQLAKEVVSNQFLQIMDVKSLKELKSGALDTGVALQKLSLRRSALEMSVEESIKLGALKHVPNVEVFVTLTAVNYIKPTRYNSSLHARFTADCPLVKKIREDYSANLKAGNATQIVSIYSGDDFLKKSEQGYSHLENVNLESSELFFIDMTETGDRVAPLVPRGIFLQGLKMFIGENCTKASTAKTVLIYDAALLPLCKDIAIGVSHFSTFIDIWNKANDFNKKTRLEDAREARLARGVDVDEEESTFRKIRGVTYLQFYNSNHRGLESIEISSYKHLPKNARYLYVNADEVERVKDRMKQWDVAGNIESIYPGIDLLSKVNLSEGYDPTKRTLILSITGKARDRLIARGLNLDTHLCDFLEQMAIDAFKRFTKVTTNYENIMGKSMTFITIMETIKGVPELRQKLKNKDLLELMEYIEVYEASRDAVEPYVDMYEDIKRVADLRYVKQGMDMVFDVSEEPHPAFLRFKKSNLRLYINLCDMRGLTDGCETYKRHSNGKEGIFAAFSRYAASLSKRGQGIHRWSEIRSVVATRLKLRYLVQDLNGGGEII